MRFKEDPLPDSEFRVKLHLKTDILQIGILVFFACNLTRNSRVRYYEFSYKITMQSVTQTDYVSSPWFNLKSMETLLVVLSLTV